MRVLSKIGAAAVALTLSALVGGVTAVPATAQSAIPGPPSLAATQRANLTASRICYNAHVAELGWMGWTCDFNQAGTTGRSLSMQAIAIETSEVGGVCARAHVAHIGWMGRACGSDGSVMVVGTTGRSLGLQALELEIGSGTVCAQVHVGHIGWMDTICGDGPITVGTTGRSLDMQAIRIAV
jgi:uncharacterized protein YjdB